MSGTHPLTPQERYDDAMFDFSQSDYESAIRKLEALLRDDPAHFEAQLALGMAFYRREDYAAAIAEGHRAEALRPKEQLVHTNLSLFYMKSGDKQKAEHHGLQARIASWRETPPPVGDPAHADSELPMAQTKPPPAVMPERPWNKKKPENPPGTPPSSSSSSGSGSSPAH